MPRPANPIDYRSIADVLVTIEYRALDSPIHRRQVIRELDPTIVADRTFSLRQQFPDQWYDLHNAGPDSSGTRAVRWRTERTDFPANLSDLTISNVALYVVRRPGEEFEVPVEHLLFTEDGTTGPVGGPAVSVDGLISARQGNAPALTELIGRSPAGTWELALRSAEIGERLREGSVEDILLADQLFGAAPALAGLIPQSARLAWRGGDLCRRPPPTREWGRRRRIRPPPPGGPGVVSGTCSWTADRRAGLRRGRRRARVVNRRPGSARRGTAAST